MPVTLRQPNTDAGGNSLSGQSVNYDLSTGDRFTVNGQTFRVLNTWTHGAQVATSTAGEAETYLLTYRELLAWGARYI